MLLLQGLKADLPQLWKFSFQGRVQVLSIVSLKMLRSVAGGIPVRSTRNTVKEASKLNLSAQPPWWMLLQRSSSSCV